MRERDFIWGKDISPFEFYHTRTRKDIHTITYERGHKGSPQVAIVVDDSKQFDYGYESVGIGVYIGQERGQKQVERGIDVMFDVTSFAELYIPKWPNELDKVIEVKYKGNRKLLSQIINRGHRGRYFWNIPDDEHTDYFGLTSTPYTSVIITDTKTSLGGKTIRSFLDKYLECVRKQIGANS
jgi:hypothetical protein